MTDTQYDRTASDEIAANVRDRRKRHGWNAYALAERCAATGAPWLSVSVIQNIEHGRPKDGKRTRLVAVEELLALSAALGVSPPVLCPDLAKLPEGANVDLKRVVEEFNTRFDELEALKAELENRARREGRDDAR